MGAVRQTARDAVVLEVMAHQYGLPLDLLAPVLGVSASRASGVVSRWRRAGWVRSGRVDSGSTWVWPVRSRARELLGWEVSEWAPRPAVCGHVRAVAATRLHRVGLNSERWESERFWQHQVGWRHRRGERVPHLPDGVEILPDGRRLLVEVELTAKSRSRYLDGSPGRVSSDRVSGLLSDVASRARELECAGVVYWCAPKVLKVVQEVVGEYAERVRESRARVPLPEGAWPDPRWAVRDISEVPGWRVEPPQR